MSWLSACLNWATLQCAPSQRSTIGNLLAFSFSWAILHSTPLTICWLSPGSLSLINGQDGIQCMLLNCDRLVRRGLHVLRLRSETRIRDRISIQYSLTGPLILQISHGDSLGNSHPAMRKLKVRTERSPPGLPPLPHQTSAPLHSRIGRRLAHALLLPPGGPSSQRPATDKHIIDEQAWVKFQTAAGSLH